MHKYRKQVHFFSAGIDYRRQNLTSKVDPVLKKLIESILKADP